jgi:hypothetical protein
VPNEGGGLGGEGCGVGGATGDEGWGWCERVMDAWGEELPLLAEERAEGGEGGRGRGRGGWGGGRGGWGGGIHFLRLGGDSLAAMRSCKKLSQVIVCVCLCVCSCACVRVCMYLLNLNPLI